MALTFGLSTVRDLFAKLRRDAALLDETVTTDRFFNFVVTGYSMIDWVKNDPSVPKTAKDSAAVQRLYDDTWIKTCGDLATAVKHFSLTKRKPIASSATSDKGYGAGRYGKGPYGVGEASIRIELTDGSAFDCFDLVKGVIDTWDRYFKIYAI
jgi:hypothetical protein